MEGGGGGVSGSLDRIESADPYRAGRSPQAVKLKKTKTKQKQLSAYLR